MNKKIVFFLTIQSIVLAVQIYAMENEKPPTQSMETLLLNNKDKVSKEGLYVVYLADAKAANTLNNISECGGVRNFKQALLAMDGEYEAVAPCEELCCKDIWVTKKFNAEKTLEINKNACDLYEKIDKLGTIEETKQVWGVMGSYIFLKPHHDSNEDFTSLMDTELVTWIKKFDEFNEPARKVPDCLDVFCLGFEHFKIFDFESNHPKRGELKARYINGGY